MQIGAGGMLKKRFADIHSLLKNHILTNETPDTETLHRKLAHVRKVGFFTKSEFLTMCEWKSPRKRSHYEANTKERINFISHRVSATKNECERIILLDSLEGVGVPVASAILMLTDPQLYGVIDTRVWQALYLYGEVNYNPKGTGLTAVHWMDYLPKLRLWANEFGVSVRNIERTLFEHHKEIQEGNLYA